jgi:hypothetical protein
MKYCISLVLIFFSGCIHSYDRIATKKSKCMFFDAKNNKIIFSCKEKKDYTSPKLKLNISYTEVDEYTKKYKLGSKYKKLDNYIGENNLPYTINSNQIDSVDYVVFQVRYLDKRYYLSLYKNFKKDSIYYFLEY